MRQVSSVDTVDGLDTSGRSFNSGAGRLRIVSHSELISITDN